MTTRLKICGITNLADARAAVDCGAELLGFNFYDKSPRYLAPAEARAIIAELPPRITPVGILVAPSAAQMTAIRAESGVHALQIYDPVGVARLDTFGFPVVFAMRLQPGEVPRWPDNGADMVLLDTYSASEYGGTGTRFSWSAITDEIPRSRLMLAGGITVANIAEAVRQVRPAVIDVASGAEAGPRQKDPALMAALAARMREADAEGRPK
jgi:phosphoribosylanthranilate isomerase